jgi:uracil phosphoribosyltransferase
MSIFVSGVESIRSAQNLENWLPQGYDSLQSLDERCKEFVSSGQLVVVDTPDIRSNMLKLKDQSLSTADFRRYADELHTALVDEATERGLDAEAKAALSVRAALAFLPIVLQKIPDCSIGFITQERDEENPKKVMSLPKKLGSFTNMHAFLFDPMLATGGSMLDMAQAVSERGSSEITAISSFATPQGAVAILDSGLVHRLICPPLEAGLNANAFIVGGLNETAMLGDFGDRYFGIMA